MSSMFFQASSFNQPIGNWDVSNVINMSIMFAITTYFNQPLSNWNVSKVTNMAFMFQYANSFNNPLDNWDVGSVTKTGGMFHNTKAFNQPLGDWNLTSVTAMDNMLLNSAIDCLNMTQTLQGWAANPLTPENITFGAGTLTYGNEAAAALNTLRAGKNWTITIGVPVECTPLDVSLIRFDARSQATKVTIEWATASETDNDYFEIERSQDARSWHSLARTKGAGTVTSVRTYQMTDHNPLQGNSYYRLKIVDLAGKTDYSHIRAVNISSVIDRYIYPNPATTSLTLSGNTAGTFTIFNSAGDTLYQSGIVTENQQIPITHLPVGSYFLKMGDGWQTRFVKK